MKNSLVLVVISALFSFSFFPQEHFSGNLGDVKYSILDPEQFTKENGPGWVIMQGQSIAGSDLTLITGQKKLPDSRGVFIRGMNLGRDAKSGDSDGNRLVGSYQWDSFKKHNHPYTNPQGTQNLGHFNSDGWEGKRDRTGQVGGDETRPKNITLYIYIKINQE